MHDATTEQPLTIDLLQQQIVRSSGERIPFTVKRAARNHRAIRYQYTVQAACYDRINSRQQWKDSVARKCVQHAPGSGWMHTTCDHRT
jgi:hypothetical protein